MAEENKAATEPKEEKKSGSEALKKGLKIIIGAILVIGGLALWWRLRIQFITVLAGCIGPFLILVGAIVIALANE